ncbi:MAG: LexA family transcriptional regulator [Pedobacter sp.]|nr:MAG: LexA family transcriptional regulator [Pedobacter sp.]
MIRKVQQRPQQIVSGFKSPADDYLEGRLDISEMLVIDPHCTFYFKMGTGCMLGYGIQKDALLIVDKSLQAINNSIVIVSLQGELLCRALEIENNHSVLVCDDNKVLANNDSSVEIWGVVIAVCFGVLPKGLRKGRYSHVCTM